MRTYIRLSRLLVVSSVLCFFLLTVNSEGKEKDNPVEGKQIGMAVEFMDHAACAYVAREKGWFKKSELGLSTYESYVTGMALASALARGDIQAAYICLVPAINAYANGKVPIKVVSGTHRYGYGLVVNPEIIKTVRDLEEPGLRIGCVREGGAVDVLCHKVIDTYGLDETKVLPKLRRMNPSKQCWAVKTRKLDAAFLPEQWATMAEDLGFRMLLTSQDVWPEMQGSVLVVKEGLIQRVPAMVGRLVEVTQRATDFVNQHPSEAARITARHLSVAGKKTFPAKTTQVATRLEITPEILGRSMARMEYTTSLDPRAIQETIDYIHHLGYIRHSFRSKDILDLRFLR